MHTTVRLAALALSVHAAVAQAAAVQAPSDLLAGAAWRIREVAVGVEWRQARLTLFGSPQQLTVLTVRNRDPDVRVRVAAPPRGRSLTSELAAATRAAAAVNGGFFAEDGSPVGLVASGGRLLHGPDERRRATVAVRGDDVVLLDAGDVERALSATQTTPDGAETSEAAASIDDALAAGPWLLRAGASVAPQTSPRHPRTAIGSNGRATICVTLDGRNEAAGGVTLDELAQVMAALGCSEALNLDGGGSTTMWVQSLGGVVNCPCDNKTFDAEGERKVGNALVVLAQPIWTRDEESAVLTPADGATPLRDAGCVDGDALLVAAGGSARFELGDVPLLRATVEVFTRAGDKLSWELGARSGTFTAQRTAWYALDEFEWAPAEARFLTLRAVAPLRLDAVRVVAAAD
ncbi:MAG: phosphodiester glycosidase family protein [Planctomycetota bacterium]